MLNNIRVVQDSIFPQKNICHTRRINRLYFYVKDQTPTHSNNCWSYSRLLVDAHKWTFTIYAANNYTATSLFVGHHGPISVILEQRHTETSRFTHPRWVMYACITSYYYKDCKVVGDRGKRRAARGWQPAADAER